MRKFSIRVTFLCILALIVCAAAWAVSVGVSNLKEQDANVKVETITSSSGDPMFQITRTNAEKDKLYLVVIRSGGEADVPTTDNVVYMDMVKAEGNNLNVSNVYPKSMDQGTYRVYMSDYEQGELKQVATFEYAASNPPKLGDVDGNGVIDMDDAIAIMRHVVKLSGWDLSNKANVADINHSGNIDMDDAIIVMRHVVKLLNIEEVYGR